MSVLFITPNNISHYLPLSAIGLSWKAIGKDVIVATGPALAERVQKDGFKHINLVLGEGSNSCFMRLEEQAPMERARLSSYFEATGRGMIATLRYQAQNRLHDLLWRPRKVAKGICDIIEKVQPKLIISVQLCYNATSALLALRVPFVTFVTGHPAQFPTKEELYGFPYYYPSRFRMTDEELKDLEKICREVQSKFTKEFNKTMMQIEPKAIPVENGFAAASPNLILFNYPGELALYRKRVIPKYAYFIGSAVRNEFIDSNLEKWLLSSKPDLPTIYISFGTVLSARSDVLKRIVQALRSEPVRVILSSGIMNPKKLGVIPDHWMVRSYLPQVAILPHSDLVICHGGNNTVTEALTAGIPLLVAPFSSDQFFGAADIERHKLGEVFEPNTSSVNEIRELVYIAMKARNRTKNIGEKLRAWPGPEKALQLCQKIFDI